MAASPCAVFTKAARIFASRLSFRLPPLTAVLISAALPALARLTLRLFTQGVSLQVAREEAPSLL
ncbi:CRISPR-associated protein Cas5, partial [Neisseria meningitidis]|uniref:CRISPR-associated protein Cas5 n=1 Tax=Neisseria meningitidis TaxID=487 RepID=UPI003980622F